MYKYKIVRIKHSVWTGKPEEDMYETINDYAEDGWRLVQVLQPNYHNWSMSGGMKTELIFEKTVEEYMKDRRNYHNVGELV